MSEKENKEPVYFLAIEKINIDRGDHNEELSRGDKLDSVPPCTLAGMIRTGTAVDAETWDKMNPPDVEGDEIELEDPPVDFKLTSVSELGLPTQLVNSLEAAELKTVSDVIAYGASHDDSLVSINGVAEPSEKLIREAIAELANKTVVTT